MRDLSEISTSAVLDDVACVADECAWCGNGSGRIAGVASDVEGGITMEQGKACQYNVSLT